MTHYELRYFTLYPTESHGTCNNMSCESYNNSLHRATRTLYGRGLKSVIAIYYKYLRLKNEYYRVINNATY